MNRKLRDVLILVVSCLLLLWCIPSVGQVLKGSISGTAVDQQGAVVSGATVKAINTATGAVLSTTSDSAGLFRFNLIPAGDYKVEVSAPNFKTSVQNNVLVSAGRDTGLGTIKLTVGEANTTVEVTAEAPLIETTQAQVTNTFSGLQLQTFAGVQENEGLDNLALFVPGVSAARDNGFSNTNGGSGFSVNGLRGRNNDQQIDGQNNNDNSVGGPGLFVSDAEFVSQYVLVTNQFGPEYGRNAGSVVNIVTKSGGNAWHGSLYGNENNSWLNAMSNTQKRFTFINGDHLTKPPRLNDEFGGFTIGGPFVKNKAFFFGGFDQEIVGTITPITGDAATPTPAGLAQLNGCFPGSTTLAAWNRFGPYAISAGSPIPSPLPTNAADPSQRSFLNIDVGTCPGVQFGGVTRFVPQPVHNFNFITRTDLQLGSDTITSRYIFNRGNSFNNDFGDAAAGYPVNVPALSQAMLVSWTHNLSSHMVNEARGSFGRLNVDFGGNSFGTVPTGDHLDQGLAQILFRFPTCSFSGEFPCIPFMSIGTATNLPQFRIVNTWQAQDNWNYVMGKHQLKAGVNWTYQRSPNGFLPNVDGQYRFSGWSSSFMNNVPNRIRVAEGPTGLDFREYDTFLYGGDDWKISQNLTLQLGVTWSYYGQPANLFNSITTSRESNSATAFWNPALPLSVRTFPTFPAPKNDFGPSLGFAYSPQWGGFLTGHGKTTIRGGYRFLYDPPFYNIYINMATAAPEVFLQTFTGGNAAAHPMPTVPLGPNVRSSLSSALTPGVLDPRTQNQTTMQPNFGPDKVHTWTLGIERELTKNSAIEARYAGNRAYNLFQSVDANPFIADLKQDFPNLVPANLTPCPATQQVGPGAGTDVGRVNCGSGVVRSRTNSGYSYYNGVQVEFRANNLFKQLTVRSSYTFSKNLDNVSEIFSTFGAGNSVAFAQNPLNQTKGEYGFSGLDYPNTWNILFTEQLPFFKEQHGLAGHLLGGWALSANYLLQSGQRYTPVQAGSAFLLPCGGTPSTCTGTSQGNYYDSAFIGAFVGVDTARPFLGNSSAPFDTVGMFAQDACFFFALTGTESVCTLGLNPATANTLISLNALNQGQGINPGTNPVVVTKNDVHFIVNSGQSQSIFGTPFGNTPRNIGQDAITNVGNFSVFKNIRLGEHSAFEFRATMLNAFNHFNFTSVDPFVEDAGSQSNFTGFANPALTGAAGRRILFGGKLTF
jgi:carboxypeptidase family protein